MEIMSQIANGFIPNIEEIDKLEYDVAQKVIAELRRLYSNKILQGKWEHMTDNNKFFNYCMKYQVAKDRRSNVYIGEDAIKYVSKSRGDKKSQGQLQDRANIKEEAVYEIIEKEQKSEYALVHLRKEYTAQQLINLFERLTMFLDNNSMYEINIELKEIL